MGGIKEESFYSGQVNRIKHKRCDHEVKCEYSCIDKNTYSLSIVNKIVGRPCGKMMSLRILYQTKNQSPTCVGECNL